MPSLRITPLHPALGAEVAGDRATMHRARGDHDRTHSRVLGRIIAEGDRPRF